LEWGNEGRQDVGVLGDMGIGATDHEGGSNPVGAGNLQGVVCELMVRMGY